MRNFVFGVVFCIIACFIFNTISGKELFIRSKLDRYYFVDGIELNRDCWMRCLQELVRINKNKHYKSIKMVIADVNMIYGYREQTVKNHAFISYKSPNGNTVYYDPMNNRYLREE